MSHRNIGIKDNLVCLVVLANGLTSLFQCVCRVDPVCRATGRLSSRRAHRARRAEDCKRTEQIKGRASRQLGLPRAAGKSVRSHPLFHRLLPLDEHSPWQV
jgi:hypothetical protein